MSEKRIDDLAGAADEEVRCSVSKNAAAVALGRLGGVRGGPARAAALNSARRSEIARNAAIARWGKQQNEDDHD
jgi:hypothetical protein